MSKHNHIANKTLKGLSDDKGEPSIGVFFAVFFGISFGLIAILLAIVGFCIIWSHVYIKYVKSSRLKFFKLKIYYSLIYMF